MSGPDVVHVLPHARSMGGTEHTVLDLLLAPALAGLDQRVSFVRPTGASPFPPERVLPFRELLARPPRIVHGWLLQGNAGGALVRARRPATPLVTSERNLGTTLTPATRAVERVVARLETVATANSSAVREAAVARIPRRARRMRVIAPGVAAPARPPRIESTDAVMVGRLHPVKDHATAIAAWGEVIAARPQARLTILGDGPEREALRARAAGLGIGDRVELLGDRDPAPWLHGARLFLSTSRSEGFSRALLEALATGRATVATTVGGVLDLPADAVRAVPPGDAGAIARAVLDLLDDPDARAAQAEAGARASARFAPAAFHAAHRALYRELGVG